MGAMIARVVAPAGLVLPPVWTPNCSSQPWIDGSYEASMYCSPRSDAGLASQLAQNGKLHPLAAAGTSVRRISVLPPLRIVMGQKAPRHRINIKDLFLCDSRSL